MRTMCFRGWTGWIILLASIVSLISNAQKYSDVEFSCRKGFTHHESYCYQYISSKMTWKKANNACTALGSELVKIDDQIENDYVKSLATEDMFWIGLSRPCSVQMEDHESIWAGETTPVSLYSEGMVWNVNEPDTTAGACVAGYRDKAWSFLECDNRLPFVCKYSAYPKGFFTCNSGDGVYGDRVCDGVCDCDDGSDEYDCSATNNQICSRVFDSSGTHDILFEDSKMCEYTIKADVDERIKLTVESTHIADTLQIYTGGSSIKNSYLLQDLTTKTFLSGNNMMFIRFQSNHVNGRDRIKLTWTYSVPEVINEDKLPADADFQTLQYPPALDGVPLELSTLWTISSDDMSLITLQFVTIDLPQDSHLTVRDGEEFTATPVFNEIRELPNTHTWISTQSTVSILLVSSKYSGGTGIRIMYKKGCEVAIQASQGVVQSPGKTDTNPQYPLDIKCSWTITRPVGVSEPLSLMMSFFDVDATDSLKVYNTSSGTPEDFSGNLTDIPDLFSSTDGYLKLEFTSNKALTAGGFEGAFSVDCPALDEFKIQSSPFKTVEVINCSTGESFKQEEINAMPQTPVAIECLEGGKWNFTRTPSCQVTYCGQPPGIENGKIENVTKVTYGGVVTYKCDGGFSMSANPGAQVKCLEDGNWAQRPTCDSTPCSPQSISVTNGYYTNETASGHEFGDVVLYHCNSGYEIVGNKRAYCRTSGTYSHEAPNCQRVKCPTVEVANGNINDTDVEYEDVVELKCIVFYGINGTSQDTFTFTCGADRTYDSTIPNCMDIDECSVSDTCATTNRVCDNFDGGFSCVCPKGFTNDPMFGDDQAKNCTDIAECAINNGRCDQNCTETAPGYQCSCEQKGYELYVKDGQNNLFIPASETGLMYGDMYYINHTCIRSVCPHPGEIENGQLLNTNRTFYFEDTVSYVCNHGYKMGGASTITCGAGGSWMPNKPNCSIETCSSPNTVPGPFQRAFPVLGTSIEFGNSLTIECKYGEQMMNRTAYCAYNSNGSYELQGDSMECPVIDCLQPRDLPGTNFTLSPGDTFYMSTLTFECEDGFSLDGGSSMYMNTTVTCMESGRWDYGNLTCTSKRCKDPGTPGGAKQEVTNYEVGQTLTYVCERKGFTVVPAEKAVLVCSYNATSNEAEWNITGDLPQCLDTTPPEIQNCNEGEVIFVQDSVPYTLAQKPSATDNSGALRETMLSGYYDGKAYHEVTTVNYTAVDFSGNSKTCLFTISVFNDSAPLLVCVEYVERWINSSQGYTLDPAEYVRVYGGVMTLTPSSLTVNDDFLSQPQTVVATATSPNGFKSSCSFKVYTKAETCLAESFPDLPNADETCSGDSDQTCTVTCASGYVHQDGAVSKAYQCTGNNTWSPALPPEQCREYVHPIYSFEVTPTYAVANVPASLCSSDHESKIRNSLSTFSTRASVCSADIGGVTLSYKSKEVKVTSILTTFDVVFNNKDLTDSQKTNCSDTIKAKIQDGSINLLYSGTLNCGSSFPSVSVSLNAGNTIVTSGANTCPASTDKTSTDVGGEKCLKCGPGEFRNGSVCSTCPDGLYNPVSSNSTACMSCDSGMVPSADKASCIDLCKDGFYSNDGRAPCMPCPYDTYWHNATFCKPCDANTSTVWSQAANSSSECIAACPAGSFSQTGYLPCTLCPLHHYQIQTGQTACVECDTNLVTNVTGADNSSYCVDKASQLCPSVSCSSHGNCTVKNHAVFCQCDSGYTGANCETEINPCDASPCKNNGTCTKTGVNSYTCACLAEKVCTMVENGTGPATTEDVSKVANIDACKEKCLNNKTCVAATFTNGTSFCYIYISDPQGQSGEQNTTFLVKSCNTHVYFDGSDCENDVTDGCQGNKECGLYGMCQDLPNIKDNNFKCLCASTGQYIGSRCTLDTNLCDPNPCQNGGSCTSEGSVRYHCVCPQGFTGEHCEMEMDYCGFNPMGCLHGGQCKNTTTGYECGCEAGYTGANCQGVKDLCDTNPCGDGGSCYSDYDNKTAVCNCHQGYSLETDNVCTMVENGTGPVSSTNVSVVANIDACKEKCRNNETCVAATFSINGSFCYIYTSDPQGIAKQPNTIFLVKSCETKLLPYPCVEDDNCANNPCKNNGTCDKGVCTCAAGFTGAWCQHNIDDCKDMPCKNGGACMDQVDGYECNCTEGFTGVNCSVNINDCVGQCMGEHVDTSGAKCTDLVHDYMCVCKPGWRGKNCTENINECDSRPCQHGGTCTDGDNDYSCNCTQGWQGKDCSQEENFCSSEPCQNNGICFNMTTKFFCRCNPGTSGDTCANDQSLCSIVSPCFADGGSCTAVNGTTKCDCKPDYIGKSCQLYKDSCSHEDTCKNEATCTMKEIGATCTCAEGYSSNDCSVYDDPCDPNPCPATATCQKDEKNNFLCLCPDGKPIVNSACSSSLPTMDDFDLTFQPMCGTNGAYLYQPAVVKKGDIISLMFWAHFSDEQPDCTIVGLQVVSVGAPKPSFEYGKEPEYFLSINGTHIMMKNDTGTVSYALDTAINTKSWQRMVVSWNSTGHVRIFQGFLKMMDEMTNVPLKLDDNQLVQIVVGRGCAGRVTRVVLWNSWLNDDDVVLAYGTVNYPMTGTVAQGWYNYYYSLGTTRTKTSMLTRSTDKVCDVGVENSDCSLIADRTAPDLTCPKDQTRSGKQLIQYDKLKTMIVKSGNNESLTMSTVPSDYVYTFGRKTEAVFIFDNAHNYAFCRFKVYHAYNEKCPEIRSSSPLKFCPNSNSSVCGVTCADGKIQSRATPRGISCSKLKVFNYKHPFKPYFFPGCSAKVQLKKSIKLKLKFKLLIECSLTVSSIETVKGELHQNLISNGKFPGLCKKQNDKCSTLSITHSCDNANVRDIIFDLSFDKLDESITNTEGRSFPAVQALRVFIFEFKGFNLETKFPSSTLEYESVALDVTPVCQDGYQLMDDICVQCGAGTKWNGTHCELCPLGSYQNNTGENICEKCASNQTTLAEGAQSVDECVPDCPAGQYLNDTECAVCPMHFYQEQSGQTGCFPCPLGKKTESTGTKLQSDCKDDCPAGQELSNGVCTPCQRGFYRSRANDFCLPCSNGNITNSTGTVSEADCDINNCTKGQEINQTMGIGYGTCMNCPYDKYQPVESPSLAHVCIACEEGYATRTEASIDASSCTFVCPPGQQVVSTEKCEACPRGFYRNNSREALFSNCTACPSDTTTETEGATDLSSCSIPICPAGQEIVDGKCKDCALDTYQELMYPNSTQRCQNCSMGDHTKSVGSNSSSQCIYVCEAGTQAKGDDSKTCMTCPRGSYRDDSRDMYFVGCKNCSSGKTTEMDGAKMASECSIPICPAGQEIVGGECTDCALDTYQELMYPNSTQRCQNCSMGDHTKSVGSNSSSQCIYVCEAGTQAKGDDPKTCMTCPRGSYRNDSRDMYFVGCKNCSSGKTTEMDGAKTASECNIDVCNPGYILNAAKTCEECPHDTYQDIITPNSSVECQPCPSNQGTKEKASENVSKCVPFCGEGEQYNGTACVSCPQGTWNNGNMTMRFEQCSMCVTNYTTVGTGATHPDNCTLLNCSPGYKISGDNCVPCGFGKYQSMYHQTTCNNCPNERNTSTETSVSQQECQIFCDAGKQGTQNNDSCIACSDDYFKSLPGLMTCQQCTGNYTSNKDRTTCDVLYCDRGFFMKDNSCSACEVGFYKDTRGNGTCTKCDDGWTTIGVGADEKADCSEPFCVPGKTLNGSSCELCAEGKYKSTHGNEECQSCPSNSTTHATGATSSANCTKVICNTGEKRISATEKCEKCELNFYQDKTGQDSCNECPTDHVTLGTGSTNKSECIRNCAAGSFIDVDKCSPCLLDTYQPEKLQYSCLNCSSGYYTDGTGKISIDSCLRSCSAGSKREGDSCVGCPVGSYQDKARQVNCTSCGSGKTTMQVNSTSSADCVDICQTGEQYNSGTKACDKCAVGYYKDTVGNNAQCTQCSNKLTSTTGSTSASDCTIDICQPGTYLKVGDIQCTQCPKGTYQDEVSQISCKDCSSGTTTSGLGADSSTDCFKICPDGLEYNFATSVCKDCPKNFYTDRTKSEFCIACPSGTENYGAGSTTCYPIPDSATAVPTLTTNRVNIKFSLKYKRVQLDCNNNAARASFLQSAVARVKLRLSIVLKKNVIEIKLVMKIKCCGVGCSSLIGRRKRATENDLELDAEVSNTSKTVDDGSGTEVLAESQVGEDTQKNPGEYATDSVVGGTEISNVTTTTICETGSYLNAAGNCEQCGLGKYGVENQCNDCDLNTYTDKPGQSSCLLCSSVSSIKIYTLAKGTNSSSNCVSICKKDLSYCNKGTCKEGSSAVSCECPNTYSGSRCDVFTDPAASPRNDAIIWGVVGGCGALMLVIVIIVACCCLRGKSKSSNGKSINSYDEDDLYKNPLYDNRPQMTPTFRNSAHRNLAFHAEQDYYSPQGMENPPGNGFGAHDPYRSFPDNGSETNYKWTA